MSSNESPYLDNIREALSRSLTLVDFPCQHVDGYNKPEIELQNSKELLLDPIDVRRNEQEYALIERSLNSVRISVKVRHTRVTHSYLLNLPVFMRLRDTA